MANKILDLIFFGFRHHQTSLLLLFAQSPFQYNRSLVKMDTGHKPPPYITKLAGICPFCGRKNENLNDLTLNENDPHGLSWTTKCPTVSCGSVYWICTMCLQQPILKSGKEFKKHRKFCLEGNLKHKEDRLRRQNEGPKAKKATGKVELPSRGTKSKKKPQSKGKEQPATQSPARTPVPASQKK